ncbi:MAG: hypothetical protein VB118_01380 [Oscillospiraceae bacterium]|nr:hypothetical protein [Oscillospiraceae bacterium]
MILSGYFQFLMVCFSIENVVAIEPHNTLIILDEVQKVPAVFGSLKCFAGGQ